MADRTTLWGGPDSEIIKFIVQFIDHPPSLYDAATMNSPSDTDAFVQLLSKHEPQIRGAIMILVSDWHDAQEIMQRVSILLWRKFDTFEPGTNFLAWAMEVAKFQVKDHWKREKIERRLFTDEFVDLVADDSSALAEELNDRRRLLKLCMDRLKPKDREMLHLRYYESASVDKISAAMGGSVAAVYKALGRMRTALADCVSRRLSAGNFE